MMQNFDGMSKKFNICRICTYVISSAQNETDNNNIYGKPVR